MKEKNISISKHSFEEDTELLQIREWQNLGVSAIWNVSFEILDQWFVMRGIDPATQRVDRSKIRIRKVHWLENNLEEQD